MHLIIPFEQKCGVKERKSTDIIRNLATFRENMDHGYFVSIDQSKAFDKVNHDYLMNVLKHIGITGDFLGISKMFLQDMTSQIEVNGGRTNKVPIKRGIRQGCPFSMLLFIISTTPLIEMIKAEKNISGHTTKKNSIIKVQSYADDTTVIIKNLNEINSIITTFHKHSIASEAEINEEKTEIFKIGDKKDDKNNKYYKKIKPKVKILGAHFCENIKEETKYNLEKASKTLTEISDNKYTSLLGKMLNLNTYIYSKIWNNAYLINITDKHFKDFIHQTESYLDYIKWNEIKENTERQITGKGLGLINIKERIKTLQIKETLEADKKRPETDDILYAVGTQDTILYDQSFSGPKKENNSTKEKETIKIIIDKKEEIKNYKKRHKITKTKDLQNIFFPKEKRYYFKEIFYVKEPKLISINYQIVHDLLPIRNNPCYFCNYQNESITHIFLNCEYLKNVRQTIKTKLQTYDIDFNRETIIDMRNINTDMTAQIISQYKYIVWTYRNIAKKATRRKEIPRAANVTKKIEEELEFYKQHVAQYI